MTPTETATIMVNPAETATIMVYYVAATCAPSRFSGYVFVLEVYIK